MDRRNRWIALREKEEKQRQFEALLLSLVVLTLCGMFVLAAYAGVN